VKTEKDLLHGLGHAVGKDRVSAQPIFGLLRIQTRVLCLDRQKTGGGDKRYAQLNNSSHRCNLVGHDLSSRSGTGPRVVIKRVVHPEDTILLGVVSVTCYENVIICLSWNPR
jgi:hypothetical protein